MPRIPTSEIKQPVGLLGRLGLAGSRAPEDDAGAPADSDAAPGFHEDWVKTEPTGALAYTPIPAEADESRPRTDHVLPSGSVDLPGSPDDRSKTEPDWDGVTPRTAEAPVVVPVENADTGAADPVARRAAPKAGTPTTGGTVAGSDAATAAGASPARPKGQGRKTRP